ncbi:hypothetical protein [Deinococcus sp.]|uniref:hypothetical protein n=1 Tax=Deinococcus sp. TaxID=47478 RepID=UPI002869D92E|nr:hypothetical protein [Deinococcus sp.]
MRLLVVALALVLTLMYFTFGLRLGYVTLTPTYMLGASGTNRYTYQSYEANQTLGVEGKCTVRSGEITLRLLDPKGLQVAGQSCPRGSWGLKLVASGDPGRYTLEIELKKFSGVLDLKETRSK